MFTVKLENFAEANIKIYLQSDKFIQGTVFLRPMFNGCLYFLRVHNSKARHGENSQMPAKISNYTNLYTLIIKRTIFAEMCLYCCLLNPCQAFYLKAVQPILTWIPVKGSQAMSADLDQMPHNVVSDQGLQCVLTDFLS